MSDYLPFIVAGLATGAVYGLAGVGLVLTYKTSGVFNFAHGALATVSAYAFFTLHIVHGMPWPLAAAVCVLILGPVMGLALGLVTGRVATAGLALQVACTVGLLLAIEAVINLVYDPTVPRTVPVFLASGGFTLSGTTVRWSDVVTFGFAVAVTAALALFFRFSRSGTKMRAVVDDPELLTIVGVSAVSTRRSSWIVGATLAATSGLLFAPLLTLDPLQLTLLVVAAFGAAAIGSFTGLGLTFAGGIVIGVGASLATKFFTSGVLAGVPASLPFIVLFLVLLLFPKTRLRGRPFTVARQRPSWTPPVALRAGRGVVVLAFLIVVPSFAGIHLTAWTTMLATGIVFLSLGMLVRTSGQVSLSHVAFTAVGASAFSHLAVDHHLPWVAALLVSGLIAVPMGALLALPAIRLTGLYLALATFGFGILLQGMFYTQSYMFGVGGSGLPEPRPSFPGIGVTSDRGFYYLCLAVFALVAVLVLALTRSRLGRLMRGIAASPMAVETTGADVSLTRVLVFCLSAFLAAIGGALAGVASSTVSADSYQPILSILYFVVIIIVTGAGAWGALCASAALVLVPSYFGGAQVTTYLQLAFGAAAVLTSVVPASRRQVPDGVRAAVDRAFGRREQSSPAARAAQPSAAVAASRTNRVGAGSLELRDLRVRFGGVTAVDGLNLSASTGRVTGLIGPNGAGKTTTFNACSGLVRAPRGAIRFGGHDVTGKRPAARARLGLGRTFQKMQLLETMSVAVNVSLGAESALAGADPLRHLSPRPGNRAHVEEASARALRLCGLEDIAGRSVDACSTGQRRLVEFARCLAGDFKLLLLDEPSSGLDAAETARFGRILRAVVAERGIGVLLVEHDMSLVLDVCDDIYVLDFGKLIFHGTPGEVVASPEVRAAYLGDADLDLAVTGAPAGHVGVSDRAEQQVVA